MLILTSSIASVAEHILANQLGGKKYKHLLFIDTAAEPELGEDDDWFYADLKACEHLAEKVERFSVTGKSRDDVTKKLQEVDSIYFSGGHTAHLLSQLQKSNSLELIKELVANGLPYFSTSAGSIIAGRRLPDYFNEEEPKLEDVNGFNFVPFTLVPHWGSPYFKDRYLGERLHVVYSEKQDPLLLLTDSQYCAVDENGAVQVITS